VAVGSMIKSDQK